MPKSNIAVTHTDDGFLTADVRSATRISPTFVRITVGGPELSKWTYRGFDQWFRMAIPVGGQETRFDRLSKRYNMAGYLRYLALPKATRPAIRNYTVAHLRAEASEMDIDFVHHQGVDGKKPGIAGPWAASLPVGARIGLIDQGYGYRPVHDAQHVVLVGDESALPAVAGILRDLLRNTTGSAILEIPHEDDRRPIASPPGMVLDWQIRHPQDAPGERALAALRSLPPFPPGPTSAFVAGEQTLASQGRRELVGVRRLPKADVDFCGYWRKQS